MPKKKGSGPLLYINQTFSRKPFNHNMQEVYTSKPEIEEPEIEEIVAEEMMEEIQTKTLKTDAFREPISIEVEKEDNSHAAVSSEQKEKHHSYLKRVKPFNEMEVSERIDYLLNIPKILPPVPCVFYTTNQNYQGYLTDFEENQVTIQFHNKTTTTIPIAEIKNITMIGLKK